MEELSRLRNGYVSGRSGDVQLVPRTQLPGDLPVPLRTVDYLQHVPLLFFGPGHVPAAGTVAGQATVADIAPTLARHLGLSFHAPDGMALPQAGGSGDGPSPRLAVVVVWDGVGRNVLARHPDAWPVLRSLLAQGAWFDHATVGSSPSVTAAVHATIGTGAFPSAHGRVANWFRFRGTMAVSVDPPPDDLELLTLADQWDRSVGNRAQVAAVALREWHLGMVGHGARFPGETATWPS